jgi:hypothetical protein
MDKGRFRKREAAFFAFYSPAALPVAVIKQSLATKTRNVIWFAAIRSERRL